MTEASTNYVVACWMGERRSENRDNIADRTSFLRAHIHALERLHHSLDQVTVVLAEGGDAAADAFAKSLTTIADTPVEVLVRPNWGMSYAGWNHAHATFGDDFTHYVVVEDDYVPFADNFDDFLVSISDHYNTYVCGLTESTQRLAAISNGAIPERIWRQISFPPLDVRRCQSAWSRGFSASGHPIQEYLEYCSSPFWLGQTIRWYGHPSLSPLFVPVQALDRHVSVLGGPVDAKVMFTKDGILVPATADEEAWESLRATPLDDPCWRGRFPPPSR